MGVKFGFLFLLLGLVTLPRKSGGSADFNVIVALRRLLGRFSRNRFVLFILLKICLRGLPVIVFIKFCRMRSICIRMVVIKFFIGIDSSCTAFVCENLIIFNVNEFDIVFRLILMTWFKVSSKERFHCFLSLVWRAERIDFIALIKT